LGRGKKARVGKGGDGKLWESREYIGERFIQSTKTTELGNNSLKKKREDQYIREGGSTRAQPHGEIENHKDWE